MSLLKRINKIIKDEDLASSYSHHIILDYESILVKINKLNEIIFNLSHTRKKEQVKERKELIESLYKILKYIDISLETYIYDYADLKVYMKNNTDMRTTEKTSKKVLIALNTKTQLTTTFENIYINFKNMAKNLDNIPLKEILTTMRKVFNLSNHSNFEID